MDIGEPTLGQSVRIVRDDGRPVRDGDTGKPIFGTILRIDRSMDGVRYEVLCFHNKTKRQCEAHQLRPRQP